MYSEGFVLRHPDFALNQPDAAGELLKGGGLGLYEHGANAAMARELGAHRSTVTRDWQEIFNVGVGDSPYLFDAGGAGAMGAVGGGGKVVAVEIALAARRGGDEEL